MISIQTKGQGYKLKVKQLHSRALELVSQPDSAFINTLSEARVISQNHEYYLGLAINANIKGWYHIKNGRFSQAYIDFMMALDHMSKSNEQELLTLCSIYRNLSSLLSKSNLYLESITYYDSAQHTAEKYLGENEDLTARNDILDEINDIIYFRAIAWKRLGKLEKAEEQLKVLLDKAKSEQNLLLLSKVLIQIGLIKKHGGETTKAKTIFFEIINSEIFEPKEKAQARHNLAGVLILENKLDSSAGHLRKVIQQKHSLLNQQANRKNLKSLYISYLDYGEVLFKMNLFDEAILQWKMALKLPLSIHNSPDLFVIHDFLKKAYFQTTKLELSASHKQLFSAIPIGSFHL